MAHQAMPAVDVLRVDAVHLPHQARQVGGTGVQHEMVVVAHQAIGQHLRVEALQCQRDDAQLRGPVVVVGVDGLAPVAAGRKVVDGAGELDARGRQKARPDPCPPASRAIR
jgi:hypothetical protein